MARIRTIKPEFFKHDGLYDLERQTGMPVRVAFAGLWTVADREGRFEWRPRILKTDALPHDEVDFPRLLEVLAEHGYLERYEVGGKTYGRIPSWHRHQRVNNQERPSVLPTPVSDALLTREARVEDASMESLDRFKGEGKGREKEQEREDALARGEARLVAKAVMEELGISGSELLSTLTEICQLEMKKGAPAEDLRDRLQTQYRTWMEARPKLQITWGVPRFFGEGHWREPRSWPWREGCAPPEMVDPRRYVNAGRQA